MKRVCGIDVGYRNFAWCVLDSDQPYKPVVWTKEDLRPNKRGTPSHTEAVQMALAWVNANREMLDSCDALILESQMRDVFLIMNAAIQARFFPKTHEVHPHAMGAYFRLPRKREAKKAAMINIVKEQCPDLCQKTLKLDDLCDAWGLAFYGLKRLEYC